MTRRSARERRNEKSTLIEELQRSAEELTNRNAETEATHFEILPSLGKGGGAFWPATCKTELLPSLSSQTSSATGRGQWEDDKGWFLASPGEIFSSTIESDAVPSAGKMRLGPRLGIDYSSALEEEVDGNSFVVSPRASPKEAQTPNFPPASHLHQKNIQLFETGHPPKRNEDRLPLKIELKPRPEATLYCPFPRSSMNEFESSVPAPSSQHWHFDPGEIDSLSKLTAPSMESAVEVTPNKVDLLPHVPHKIHATDTNSSFLLTISDGHTTHTSQLAEPMYCNI